MKNKFLPVVIGLLLVLLAGFSNSDLFQFVTPDNFPQPAYKFNGAAVSQQSFELGRTLFYETALSKNDQISCGSCHVQSSAFTQHGHDLSHGIDDRLGTRNSP